VFHADKGRGQAHVDRRKTCSCGRHKWMTRYKETNHIRKQQSNTQLVQLNLIEKCPKKLNSPVTFHNIAYVYMTFSIKIFLTVNTIKMPEDKMHTFNIHHLKLP